MVEGVPRILLRAEGLAVAVAAVALYVDGGHSWLLFALLILAPDLSIAGYAAGPRIGAMVYDLVHTSVWPVALGLVGVVGDADGLVALALVWLAHIGVDRAIGYGLKYPTRFTDTHLQRV